MEKEKSVLIRFLGDTPYMRVIDFLIDNIGYDYSKTEISRGAGVGWSTLYTLWDRLEEFKLVTPTRKYGKTQLYKINDKSSVVKKLLSMELDLIEQSAPHVARSKTAA